MTKILVIDDEDTVRENLKSLLKLDDYEVFTAENGPKGLETLIKEHPDIVILDIKMPGMDGIEVLKRVKELSKGTEVIMMTGHGGIETAIEAMHEGAFYYIQKPIEYDELEIVIKKALEKEKVEERIHKLSHAVEQSPSVVMITDTVGIIEYVNPKFLQLTGYSLEEVVGKKPNILKSGAMGPEKYKQLWDTITSGKAWRGEFQNKKKNGELFWESASISSIRNSEGVITHFLAVKEDITERKKIEEALEARNKTDNLITLISMNFANLEIGQVGNSIKDSLEMIGKFTNVDRGYVFLIYGDETVRLDYSYEWCSAGVQPHPQRRKGGLSVTDLVSEFEEMEMVDPFMDSAMGFPVENFHWLKEKIENHEVIYVDRVSDLLKEIEDPKMMENFILPGTQSLINIPLIYREQIIGYLGFDSVREEKTWSDEEIELINKVGRIFGNAIELKREKEEGEKFHALLDQTGEAIFLINPRDSHIIDFNKSAENMLGYSRNELLKVRVGDIEVSLSIQTVEQWQEHIKLVKASSKPIIVKGTHKRKDGSTFQVEMSLSYKTFAERGYLLSVVRDVTEQDQLQTVIKTQQQQLIQADKMASVGTMAAGVAHEINNPLNVAAGDIHLFRRDIRDLLDFINKFSAITLPPDASKEVEKLKKDMDLPYITESFDKKLSRCEEAMKRIKDIVQNLRDFSHLDKGEIVPIDVNKNIEVTLEMIPKKYKQDIEIKKEFARLPEVPCSGGQINQVFMNIMTNAFHAMERGGTLTIKTSADGKYVYIKFHNTGESIPEDEMKRLFDPFFTTKPVGQGTGLGLSISFSIMEKHGGDITIVNDQDKKGLTFIVKMLKDGQLFLN